MLLLIQYNQYIGYLFLLLIIPLLFWLYKNTYHNVLPFTFLFLFTFFAGTFDYLGINQKYILFLSELLILSIFIAEIIRQNSKLKLTSLIPLLAYLIICIISSSINDKSVLSTLLFLRRIYIVFILFWVVANYPFKLIPLKSIILFIQYLFLIQIIAAIIKLFVIGRDELYIGTFLTNGGSHTTLFTLMACTIYWTVFLYLKKPKYIWYIIGFVLVGIAGRKRAILFFIPLIFIILQLMYKGKLRKSYMKINLFLLLFIPIFFFVVTIVNPELTPGGENVRGDFSLDYVIKYTTDYNEKQRFTKEIGAGRFDATYEVPEFLAGKGTSILFFGLGPGDLTGSILTNNTKITGEEDLAEEKYNLGYGTRTGFMWILLQTGIVGIFLWSIGFINIYRGIIKYNNKNRKSLSQTQKIILHFVKGFIILVFIDIGIYSKTPIVTSAETLVLWFFIGLVFNPIFNEIDDSQKYFL